MGIETNNLRAELIVMLQKRFQAVWEQNEKLNRELKDLKNKQGINEIKGSYPFAIIDLLGYKDRTKSKSLDEVLKFHEYFLIRTNTIKSFSLSIPAPNYINVLDTLFVYPNQEHTTRIKIISIIRYLAEFLHRTISIRNNREFIPLRGAISFGAIFVNPNYELTRSLSAPLVLGEAVIKGYEWEKSQNWLGISIDPNSVEVLKSFDPKSFDELEQQKYLINWEVPTKCGTIKTYAINFVDIIDWHSKCSLDVICQQEQREETNEVKEKYRNTKVFIQYLYKKRQFAPEFRINSLK